MNLQFPSLYLVRHGETAWSLSGQHTGLTDLPLTSAGEQRAIQVGERLKQLTVSHVFTSPLQRASRTCELAGFGSVAKIDRDLVEWDYGDYEGKTTEQIWCQHPDWNLFRDGCPGGESVSDIGSRADRVIDRIRAADENLLIFSSGHFLRVLAARWLGFETKAGQHFYLNTASLSILGYEHTRREPNIRLWNDCQQDGK